MDIELPHKSSKWLLLAQLMRLDKPVGIFLLMWPCWIGVAVFSAGKPDWRLLTLFAVGAIVMRSAGCIINDMADRKLDAAVERTRNRPLASGAITMREAAVLLLLLLTAGLVILMQLSLKTQALGLTAIIPVIAYPFMKRITNWPQLFLGITFNWGILLSAMEVHGKITMSSITLYAAFIFWTLGYDTIYAIQDIKDDVSAGIKSSAISLGNRLKTGISMFYALFVAFLAASFYQADMGINSALHALIIVMAHLGWQIIKLDINSTSMAMLRFKSNQWLGFAMFLALVII